MFDLDKLLTGAGLDDNTIKEENKNSVSASPDSIPDAVKEKNLSAADPGPASPDSEKITNKTPKNKKKRKEDNNNDNITEIIKDSEAAAGADVAGAVSALPFGFIDTIESIINDYCIKYNIEDMCKASQSQWAAACMLIGKYIKENGLLLDIEKNARQGGRGYDVKKLSELVEIWAFLCSNFKKTPLASDFIRLAGVSDTWFYNCNGNSELTAASGQIYKKVLQYQEFGVASDLADGRKNPTGLIFLSKAKMGWSESGPDRIKEDQQQEKQKNIPDFSTLGLPKL